MKQRKIAVIAGTSDATDWIRSLPETDSVTAFVATPYGKEILAGTNCTVHVGRLDAAGFAEALTGFDEVVDASHPFAVVVTETVKAVCQAKQIPYTRISRPTLHYDYEKLHVVFVRARETCFLPWGFKRCRFMQQLCLIFLIGHLHGC